MGIGDLIRRSASNIFAEEAKSPVVNQPLEFGAYTIGGNPTRQRSRNYNDKSIVEMINNRIGVDVASSDVMHVRLDAEDRYSETIASALNDCLTVEANIDQGARAFFQDAAMTMCETGVVAITPIDTSKNPVNSNSYDIYSMGVGEVTAWFPQHVRIRIYNPQTGLKQEVVVHKRMAAIIENPFYNIMNGPQSTLQRLVRKLSLLDAIDEQVGSGKLDLIIQLPYVIKSEAKEQQAEKRRQSIQTQLRDSAYGIAYTDGTERITQLNRPVENNMLKQVEYLTNQLYSQMGLSPGIFDGSADEQTMLNYHNRTVEPILSAITQGMDRKFITKTARTQGQAIRAFRDPFKYVGVAEMAEIADKFTRNEIMSSNEIRSSIGYKPSKDPKADELRNSNMPQPGLAGAPPEGGMSPEAMAEQDAVVNQAFDDLEKDIDQMVSDASGGG